MRKPPKDLVVHNLRAHDGGDFVHVTGHIEAEANGATHIIPISYRAGHATDPAKHGEILADMHEKAKVFADRHDEFRQWEGAVEQHGDATVKILECKIGQYGQHDWKLTVMWEETRNGVKTRHHDVTTHSHPAHIRPIADVQTKVRTRVASRSRTVASVASHKEEIHAINRAHAPKAPGPPGK